MSVFSFFLEPARSRAIGGQHYRPDIDGLRALAVLAVVFYHYGVWPFSGGFVGVDVFFVISGYLIAGVIDGRLSERSFSLAGFYEGRIRRIFPALFVMLALTSIAGLIALFPDALIRLGDSMPPAAAFASNFHFKGDYFDVNANEKPLLHTWSLAVEEQFYLALPALLMLLRRWKRPVALAAVASVAAASFLAGVCNLPHNPVATFYLLPFRLWELLLGSLLALAAPAAPEQRAVREAIAFAALALIAWSVFAFTPSTPFPGLNALPPCLGAALVIYAGSGAPTAMARVLSTPPLVAIGLISYSLYLWHWPIFVIADAFAPAPFSAVETSSLIALSFVLAVLSWRLVELPFRGRGGWLSRRAVFVWGAVAIVVAAGVGEAFVLLDGVPGRYSAQVRAVLAAADDKEPRQLACMNPSAEAVSSHRLCVIGSPTAAPSFLLWGDSHADAMMPAIDAAAAAQGKAGYFASNANCAPLLGVPRPDRPDCQRFNDGVLRLARDPNIGLVFLVSRWAIYTDPAPYGPTDLPLALTASRWKTQSAPEMSAVFARGLTRTVQALTAAGKQVVIVGSVPEVRWLVPQTLARSILSGRPYPSGPTTAAFHQRQQVAINLFAQLHRQYGVTVVDPGQVLCDAAVCHTTRGATPLYRDADHLTATGARRLAPLYEPLFRPRASGRT